MKIIIVGAGQVGSSLSINLVKEGNDVTLIDKSADLLENIAEKVEKLGQITGESRVRQVMKFYLI